MLCSFRYPDVDLCYVPFGTRMLMYAIFLFYISFVVTKNLILLFEVKILFKVGNIYKDYIVVYHL